MSVNFTEENFEIRGNLAELPVPKYPNPNKMLEWLDTTQQDPTLVWALGGPNGVASYDKYRQRLNLEMEEKGNEISVSERLALYVECGGFLPVDDTKELGFLTRSSETTVTLASLREAKTLAQTAVIGRLFPELILSEELDPTRNKVYRAHLNAQLNEISDLTPAQEVLTRYFLAPGSLIQWRGFEDINDWDNLFYVLGVASHKLSLEELKNTNHGFITKMARAFSSWAYENALKDDSFDAAQVLDARFERPMSVFPVAPEDDDVSLWREYNQELQDAPYSDSTDIFRRNLLSKIRTTPNLQQKAQLQSLFVELLPSEDPRTRDVQIDGLWHRFDSKLEATTALVFHELGLLEKPQKGVNYHVPFERNGGKKSFDFDIAGTIVETHSSSQFYNQRFNDQFHDGYIEERVSNIANSPEHGAKPVYVLRRAKHLADLLPILDENIDLNSPVIDEKQQKLAKILSELSANDTSPTLDELITQIEESL